jgi:hypothetical protein
MGDESTVEIILKWKEENEVVLREVQAKLAELNTTQDKNNQSVLASAWALMNQAQGWGQVAVWAGVAAVALAPIAALILAATVATISFTVGAAAALVVLGAVALGFGALGAAIVLLGGGGGGTGSAAALATATTQLAAAKNALSDYNQLHIDAKGGKEPLSQTLAEEDLTLRLAQAQQKYNDALAAAQGPMGVLIAQLTTMKDAWAVQAEPLAKLITVWVGSAIPAVTQLGSAIMTWFGERLPGVLRGISTVLKDLAPDFENFGKFLGGVMDHVGPQIAPLAEALARLALVGVQGLITNLVRLSDWFQKELPGLGPIVAQIFGAMGNFIQGVATNWARLSDWVVANWPKTMKDASAELHKLQDAFNNIFDPSGKGGAGDRTLQGLQNIGQTLKQMSDAITTALVFIGQLNKALQPVADVLDRINTGLNQNGLWIHGQLTGGGSKPPGTTTHRTGTVPPPPPPKAVTLQVFTSADPNAIARSVGRQLRQLGAV